MNEIAQAAEDAGLRTRRTKTDDDRVKIVIDTDPHDNGDVVFCNNASASSVIKRGEEVTIKRSDYEYLASLRTTKRVNNTDGTWKYVTAAKYRITLV